MRIYSGYESYKLLQCHTWFSWPPKSPRHPLFSQIPLKAVHKAALLCFPHCNLYKDVCFFFFALWQNDCEAKTSKQSRKFKCLKLQNIFFYFNLWSLQCLSQHNSLLIQVHPCTWAKDTKNAGSQKIFLLVVFTPTKQVILSQNNNNNWDTTLYMRLKYLKFQNSNRWTTCSKHVLSHTEALLCCVCHQFQCTYLMNGLWINHVAALSFRTGWNA